MRFVLKDREGKVNFTYKCDKDKVAFDYSYNSLKSPFGFMHSIILNILSNISGIYEIRVYDDNNNTRLIYHDVFLIGGQLCLSSVEKVR